jgi:choline dehydrogenase-like flavoprotein
MLPGAPAAVVGDCDVAVIGGGPAGSTAASLFAFKALFYALSLAHLPRTIRAWRRRRDNIRDVDAASAGA